MLNDLFAKTCCKGGQSSSTVVDVNDLEVREELSAREATIYYWENMLPEEEVEKDKESKNH